MTGKENFGICRLSLIPVRREPNHQSEQVTQLLFGDHYEVIEYEKNKWLKVRVFFDQYEGWIDELQHHEISKEYFDYINRAEFKITTDITASILYHKNPQMVLMGSIIPISSTELFKMEEQFAFIGESKNLGQKREYEFLKNTVLKYQNTPYQWGGKSPFGIDCSGLVQQVFKISGYPLQRDAYQQAEQGKPISSIDNVLPGDLAFFKNGEGKINHVGIVLEEDKIIHASGKVRIDLIHEDGILNRERKIFTHTLSHFRRVLPDPK